MGLPQRLDEVDRRLGLFPSARADRHAGRWWRVYAVAALVTLVVAVVLYAMRRTAAANLFMPFPIIIGVTALQGWGVNRRRRRADQARLG